MLSLNQIKENYSWIANSSHFNELMEEIEKLSDDEREDEMNVEYNYPIYDKSKSLEELFYTINYWGVYDIPFYILDRLKEEDPCILADLLLSLITDLSLKLFVEKYIRFTVALRDEETFCEKMAKYGYLDMLEWGLIKYKELTNLLYTLSNIATEAAGNGHIHILEWLYQNHLERSKHKHISHEYLDCLKNKKIFQLSMDNMKV